MKKKAKQTQHPLLDRGLRPFIDEVFREVGFGECTQLCDVSQVQRVCGELLPDAFDWLNTRHGIAGEHQLLKSLQDLLWEPLLRYAEQLEKSQADFRERRLASGLGGNGGSQELQSTLEFMESIEDVREWLRLGPWSDEDGAACAAILELAWYKWIATIATAHLAYKVPVAIARARAAPALSKGGAPPGRPPDLDKDRIFKRCQEMERLLGRSGAAGAVAKEFDCSATRVREVRREYEAKQKNETKPAG